MFKYQNYIHTNIGGNNMTQKELLYVEDAIGHEKVIIACINNIINELDDDNLIDYMNKELKEHEKTKNNFMKLLEEENE